MITEEGAILKILNFDSAKTQFCSTVQVWAVAETTEWFAIYLNQLALKLASTIFYYFFFFFFFFFLDGEDIQMLDRFHITLHSYIK